MRPTQLQSVERAPMANPHALDHYQLGCLERRVGTVRSLRDLMRGEA